MSLRSEDVARPTSGLTPMDQYLQRSASLLLGESTDSPFLPPPPPPTSHWIIEELVSVVGSTTREPTVAVAQPSMPDLSRERPFDVHQDYSTSGASPRVLDSIRGCTYDERNGGPDFNPAYGIHLHDPRLLEYVGAPESGVLATSHGMREDAFGCAAAPTRRGPDFVEHSGPPAVRDIPKPDVLGGHVAFDRELFPSDAVQNVAPAHRVRRAAHYMAGMGLWRPPSMQGIHGPLSSSCNAYMSCTDCFPDLPQ